MEPSVREYLESIYEDCCEQEREGVLTAYGAGQGDLCIELLKKGRRPFKPAIDPDAS